MGRRRKTQSFVCPACFPSQPSRAEQVHWNGEEVGLLPGVDYRRPDALDRRNHDVDGPVPDVGALGEVGLARGPHLLRPPSLRREDVLERQLERLLVPRVEADSLDLLGKNIFKNVCQEKWVRMNRYR